MTISDDERAFFAGLVPRPGATVTVRIEVEPQAAQAQAEDFANDPLFGMWRDREDMADVAGYVRTLRTSRFNERCPTACGWPMRSSAPPRP